MAAIPVGAAWLAVFLPVALAADTPRPPTRGLVLTGAITGFVLAEIGFLSVGSTTVTLLHLGVWTWAIGVGALAGWLYPRIPDCGKPAAAGASQGLDSA